MPFDYTPSPVRLVDVTEPVDGELRSVASVTTITRALADAIVFGQNKTDELRRIRVMNFLPGEAEEFFSGCWNPVLNTWFLGGATALVRRSETLGATLVAGDEGLSGATDTITALESDPDGNMIALGNEGNVWEYNDGTSAWTYNALAFAGIIDAGPIWPDRPSMCFDPTANKWFGIGLFDGFGGAGISLTKRYTADRTTWTNSATFPASGGTYTMPRCAAKAGRIIAVWTDGATTLESAYSTDGGVNFTAGGTATISGSTWEYVNLVYDEFLDLFFATVTDSSGGTKIFSSPTGVTWTSVVSLNVGAVREIQHLEGLWCGFNHNGSRMVFSEDGGATWKSTHLVPSSNADFNRIVAGKGQFLLLTQDLVWFGPRIGDIVGDALT